ncbi:unnamed protein product, partial [Ixodes pacificus]
MELPAVLEPFLRRRRCRMQATSSMTASMSRTPAMAMPMANLREDTQKSWSDELADEVGLALTQCNEPSGSSRSETSLTYSPEKTSMLRSRTSCSCFSMALRSPLASTSRRRRRLCLTSSQSGG